MLDGRPAGHSFEGLRSLLGRLTQLSHLRPFGVSFIVSPTGLADIEPAWFELAAHTARVVEFFYGWPDRALVDIVHRGGALACWQVGSCEEAVAAARPAAT